MSSQVKIIVAMSLVAVASGAAVASIQVGLTDASGANFTQSVAAADFPTPDANGDFSLEVDFSGVGSGDFSGDVVSLSGAGSPVGSPVHFTGTNTNLQPVPVSVTVAFG